MHVECEEVILTETDKCMRVWCEGARRNGSACSLECSHALLYCILPAFAAATHPGGRLSSSARRHAAGARTRWACLEICSDRVHLDVSRCIPMFIAPQVLAACCSTQRQFQVEYLRAEAALVEANGPRNGAALPATDTDAVLLLNSIGGAADSLLASKHALLQRLRRVAKAAAVHEGDDMDAVVEDTSTTNEGLLYIRWPLTLT
jgi:hypothetical protein